MKVFNIAVAVIILLSYILLQESSASPFTEEKVEVRDDNLEAFEMQSEPSKMNDNVRDKRSMDEKDCRVCCNCCHRGPTWCGLCCEW
ncbi:hepcidin-like [Syngnathoides biaculeatus]|uniref:hepcidin-like n=1 Tax=Syngnathoides biaculeatus TaxID=300417 RepID=UPI0027AA66AD|nr:hepcidin-like [Syngnathoides biaculeatus]UQM94867.1 antimicrobial peptide hepcidin type II [Syngnathoides biaculeatus]